MVFGDRPVGFKAVKRAAGELSFVHKSPRNAVA